MPAHSLNIETRQRTHFGRLASIEDFTVSAGDVVDADIILNQPNISLYCFDVETERVFFVELPDDVDLSTAPFVYQTQYEQARRLIETDYATFRHLSGKLPKIENLIMIYSCGRSGSTLLSNALNAPSCVLSLSEPDAATQLLRMRLEKRLPDADLRDMTDCTLRMLFKPMRFKTPTHYVLKPRSEGLQMMDWFQAAFPKVKNLFSYRDALGFVSSYYRILKNTIFPQQQSIEEFATFFHGNTRQNLTYLTVYLDAGTTVLDLPQQLTLWWLAMMEWYVEQVERTIPALAIPYSQLNRQREAALKAIFDYCGLPMSEVDHALGVFERDAQEGTLLARQNAAEGNQLRLTDEEREQVSRILARHPVINTTDYSAGNIPFARLGATDVQPFPEHSRKASRAPRHDCQRD